MSPERWAQIERLLDAVLDLPAGERTAFLAAHCPDDDVRAEVETLLRAEANAPAFLDGPAAAFAAAALDADARTETAFGEGGAGRHVGPYQVLRELGRGGMGVVYLAERADVGKRVALKLVRGGLAAPEAVTRFRAEQRALARLEHPHIASLHDAGVSDDGTPFFAMEYVEGRPLDAYCDAHNLSVDARLRLFVQVGRAVQHAHQHFVVHRDLKPSNILVTADGTPRLLDFGIAKVVAEAEEAEADAVHTATGRYLLTPAYAAPEQVRGEAVTAATDVYSLGVVLYELLVGQRPYEVTGTGLEAMRAVLTEEPSRPSTAVTTQTAPDTTLAARQRATTVEGLRRRLRGDLDVICLKALAKEPERRYASAEAFVEDIRRHLEGLPVTARPATAGYRVRKFVERHRQGVVLTVVAVLVLAALVGYYTYALQQERDVAQAEAAKAHEVARFLSGLFAASNPDRAQGDTLTAPELLAQGLAQAQALDAQPEVQAELLGVIGQAYRSLGDYERAAEAGDRALAASLRHGDAARVAAALSSLAITHRHLGAYAEADSLFRRAIALLRRTPEADPAVLADALSSYGVLLRRMADYEDAERVQREALAVMRRLHGEDHEHVADVLNNLALLQLSLGDYAQAETLAFDALRMRQRVLEPGHPDVALSHHNLAGVYLRQENYAQARQHYTQAITLRRAVLGPEHPDLASSLNNLAVTERRTGHLEAADSLYRAVLSIYQSVHGEDHPRVAVTQSNIAVVLKQQERYEEAERLYRAAQAVLERELGPAHPQTAQSYIDIGRLYHAQARYAEAEPLMLHGLAIREQVFSPEHPHVVSGRRIMAELYDAWGKPDEAARYR